MRRIPLISLALIAAAIGFVSCNEQDFYRQIPESPNKELNVVVESDSFMVNRSMLNKYLSITGIDKDVTSIVPIKDGNATLAYIVNLKTGWKLISADSRMTPIQAFANAGTLNLAVESDPAVQLVHGIANDIKEFKTSAERPKSGMWIAIENELAILPNASSKVTPRGIGMGMWIKQEPEYESSTEEMPHIISTKWGQLAPYNYYMPYINSDLTINANVGCVAVASGQIIYHYRKSNDRGIKVPVAAYLPQEMGKEMVVTHSSVDGWPLIIKYHGHAGMFLAQIAKELETNYTDASAYPDKAKSVFDNYLLAYDSYSGYDYYKVLYSLKGGKPVFASAGVTGGGTGHSFIIDSYRCEIENTVINYVWDPEHRITEEEMQKYPSEMFEQGADGRDTKQEIVSNEENTYLAMNWGDFGSGNEVYYLAREYSAPISGSDFSGDYYKPGKDIIHVPSWKHSNWNVTHMKLIIYNIREK